MASIVEFLFSGQANVLEKHVNVHKPGEYQCPHDESLAAVFPASKTEHHNRGIVFASEEQIWEGDDSHYEKDLVDC